MGVNLSKKSLERIQKAAEQSSFGGSGTLKRAADTQVVVNQPLGVEDEFRSLYETQGGTNVVVEPPFNPLSLIVLCTRNNILLQCIHAMEVNVDGTGHTIEPVEEKKPSTTPPFKLDENGKVIDQDPESVAAAVGKPGQTPPGEKGTPFGEKKPAAGGTDPATGKPNEQQETGQPGVRPEQQGGQPGQVPEGEIKKPTTPEEIEAEYQQFVKDREGTLTPEQIEAEYEQYLSDEGLDEEEKKKRRDKRMLGTAGDRSEENPTTEFKVQKKFGDEAASEEDKPTSDNAKSPFPPKPGAGKPPFGAKPPFGQKPGAMGMAGEEDHENDPEYKKAESFFKEPYPGQSMLTLRRLIRVDLEQTGNGYIEVVRNLKGEITLLRHLPCYSMRLVRLDPDPIMVTKKIMRDGNEIEVEMPVRERRFVQKVGAKKYYYREFGCSRDVNRDTGDWAKQGETLDPKLKGSEVLWFKVDNDAGTPYGIPRWINNLPSVMGSRKAEEYNLEFFDAGGLPPALIVVEGGAMTTTVREQLLQHLSGKGRTKHRAAVVEVQSTSGSIDRPGRVQVKVERFGDARQGDSLFQGYDENCAEHVRRAFRLPPLFLGDSDSFNFATASISYMVAEAQVFSPERKEFDDVMNNTIMKDLGITKFKFVSKPVTLKNVDLMLKGLEMGADLITGEEKIDNINQITGLSLNYSAEVEKQALEREMQMAMQKAQMGGFGGGGGFGKPGFGGGGGKFGKPAFGGKGGGDMEKGGGMPKPNLGTPAKGGFSMKADRSPNEIVTLVNKWCVASGLEEGDMGRRERELVLSVVDNLEGANRELFDRIMATKSLTKVSLDVDGLTRISKVARRSIRR